MSLFFRRFYLKHNIIFQAVLTHQRLAEKTQVLLRRSYRAFGVSKDSAIRIEKKEDMGGRGGWEKSREIVEC